MHWKTTIFISFYLKLPHSNNSLLFKCSHQLPPNAASLYSAFPFSWRGSHTQCSRMYEWAHFCSSLLKKSANDQSTFPSPTSQTFFFLLTMEVNLSGKGWKRWLLFAAAAQLPPYLAEDQRWLCLQPRDSQNAKPQPCTAWISALPRYFHPTSCFLR